MQEMSVTADFGDHKYDIGMTDVTSMLLQLAHLGKHVLAWPSNFEMPDGHVDLSGIDLENQT